MSTGRVVAELGRPETPEETAERKARDSRLYRERKTLSNLIYALVACVVAVAVIFLAVPRSTTPIQPTVDAAAAAANASSVLGTTALVPAIPGRTNAAELRTSVDGVVSWYIGTVTPDKQYIGFTQAVNANDGWVADQTAKTLASGSLDLAGLHWTIYNNRTATGDVGNVRYAMVTQVTGADGTAQTLLLVGTADDSQFTAAATAVAESLTKGS